MPYKIEINQRVGQKVDRRWVKKIAKYTLGQVGVKKAEISVAIVGDKEMKRLNKKWRRKNRVTDVLSFDYRSRQDAGELKRRPHADIVGEIIICYPQAMRQAKENRRSLKEEIKLLLIHGLLHLCGYEHEKGGKEAERMRRMEQTILQNKK